MTRKIAPPRKPFPTGRAGEGLGQSSASGALPAAFHRALILLDGLLDSAHLRLLLELLIRRRGRVVRVLQHAHVIRLLHLARRRIPWHGGAKL